MLPKKGDRTVKFSLNSLAILLLASGIHAAEVAPQRFTVECGRSGAFVPYLSRFTDLHRCTAGDILVRSQEWRLSLCTPAPGFILLETNQLILP